MAVVLGRLHIEVYAEGEAQARFLVHGWDDVLWTDDPDYAVAYLRSELDCG